MKTFIITLILAEIAISCNHKIEQTDVIEQNCDLEIGVKLVKDSVYFSDSYVASVSTELDLTPANSKSFSFTDSVFMVTSTNGNGRWTKCFFLLVNQDGSIRWFGIPVTFFDIFSFTGRIYTFRIEGVGDDDIKGIIPIYFRIGSELDSLNVDLDKNVLHIKPALEIPPSSLPLLDTSVCRINIRNLCQPFLIIYGFKSNSMLVEYEHNVLPVTNDTIEDTFYYDYSVNYLRYAPYDTLRIYLLPI